MDGSFIERLRDATVPRAQQIYEDSVKIVYAINGEDGKTETIEIVKNTVYNHKVVTPDSLGRLLHLHAKGDSPGIVFVGSIIGTDVEAITNFADPNSHKVTMMLSASPENMALVRFQNPVPLNDVCSALLGSLSGTLPHELFLQLSTLRVNKTATVQYQIDELGIQNRDTSEMLKVTVNDNQRGTSQAKLKTNWTWKGRIFEILDKEYEIPIRLGIVPNSPLLVSLEQVRPDVVLRKATADLIKEIEKVVPEGFVVVEGIR